VLENVQVAHRICNSRKNKMTTDEWNASAPGLRARSGRVVAGARWFHTHGGASLWESYV
jgi:hypothetical protein